MEVKKEVLYNFNELYYIYLIQRLERINLYLIGDKNYPFALLEFKHWFLELQYEIKTNLKEVYPTIVTEIAEAETLIYDFETLSADRNVKRKIKFDKLGDIEIKLKYKMTIIYTLMMESIDRLNMFLKKGRNDDDINPIYKK